MWRNPSGHFCRVCDTQRAEIVFLKNPVCVPHVHLYIHPNTYIFHIYMHLSLIIIAISCNTFCAYKEPWEANKKREKSLSGKTRHYSTMKLLSLLWSIESQPGSRLNGREGRRRRAIASTKGAFQLLQPHPSLLLKLRGFHKSSTGLHPPDRSAHPTPPHPKQMHR